MEPDLSPIARQEPAHCNAVQYFTNNTKKQFHKTLVSLALNIILSILHLRSAKQ
jgi:hypothetical protein